MIHVCPEAFDLLDGLRAFGPEGRRACVEFSVACAEASLFVHADRIDYARPQEALLLCRRRLAGDASVRDSCIGQAAIWAAFAAQTASFAAGRLAGVEDAARACAHAALAAQHIDSDPLLVAPESFKAAFHAVAACSLFAAGLSQHERLEFVRKAGWEPGWASVVSRLREVSAGIGAGGFVA